jgi:multidrug efflux pump subunit AcrB
VLVFALVLTASAFLATQIGRDLFPQVDAGQIRLHVRIPNGSRIEQTERRVIEVVAAIRELLPPGDVERIIEGVVVIITAISCWSERVEQILKIAGGACWRSSSLSTS